MPYLPLWIKSLTISVVVLVAIGGITRLTHSGLSMARWKPLHFLPPINAGEWNEEFNSYKQTPEYLKVNKDIEVSEFKKIFWWEYLHRLLAKLISILTLLPILFCFKSLPTWMKFRSVSLFLLVGLQGVIGWWMVKSGLIDNPAVSHLRLATHLIMAFIIITMLLHTKWKFDELKFKKMTIIDKVFLSLIACTVFYGALVAGLKAGFIYNTFPLMEGELIPSEWSFYKPLMSNFINNPATVQLMHRLLGLTTLIYAVWLLKTYGKPYRIVTIKIGAQVLLGIATLLLVVPTHLAVTHQLWAIVIWIAALKAAWIDKSNLSAK